MARITNRTLAGVEIDWLALEIGPDDRHPHTDDELRLIWELHGDEMLADSRRRTPGRRPWVWWYFEAGRPEHLEEYPLHFEGSVDANADAIDA
jgi:hypothetical protein